MADSSVRAFYNASPQNEWERLSRSAYRKLEFEIVLHVLECYLPAAGSIIDLGGGAGRYAISLARRNYNVHLIDCSDKNIAFAQKKIEQQGLQDKITTYVGDEHILDQFAPSSVDALLCMGPLYHLPRQDERDTCLQKCSRVLQSNAPLFTSWIPRISYIKDTLRSGNFAKKDASQQKTFEEIFRTGHSSHSQTPMMYHCTINEIEPTLNRAGFELVKMVSKHGFAAFHDERVNEIANDPAAWNMLLHWVIQTYDDPHALASAEYIFACAHKKA